MGMRSITVHHSLSSNWRCTAKSHGALDWSVAGKSIPIWEDSYPIWCFKRKIAKDLWQYLIQIHSQIYKHTYIYTCVHIYVQYIYICLCVYVRMDIHHMPVCILSFQDSSNLEKLAELSGRKCFTPVVWVLSDTLPWHFWQHFWVG